MNIYSKHFDKCFPGISIVSKGPKWKRGLDFCGVLNSFKVYVCYHIIFFNIVFSNTAEFYLKTLFNLRTPLLISTDTAHTEVKKIYRLTLLFTHFVTVAQDALKTWHLLTEPSFVISAHLSNGETSGIFACYDGPTVQDKKIIVKQFPTVMKTSTFQVVVSAIGEIEVEFNFLPIRTYVPLHINGTTSMKSLQGHTLREKVAFVSHHTQRHFLNVSILDFKFVGHETPSCKFGGIWLFETEPTDMELPKFYPTEMFSSCLPSLDKKPSMQNIYSTKSVFLLLAYTFKHHSSLKTDIQISCTSCSPVIVDVCDNIQQKTEIVTVNSMLSKGFFGYGRHISEINVMGDTTECVVVQLLSKNMFVTSKDTKGHCTAIVLFHREAMPVEYKYAVKGFLSTRYMHSSVKVQDFQCPVYSVNQFFIFGGENFLPEKTKLSVLQLGNEQYLWESNDSCVFDTKKRSLIRSGFYHLTGLNSHFYLNPTNRESILLDMSLFALMPTGDLGLTFMYQPLSANSWIEIVFAPLKTNMVHSPLKQIKVGHTAQYLKHVFRKMIFEISLGSGKLTEDQSVNVDINILMRVIMCLFQFASLADFGTIFPRKIKHFCRFLVPDQKQQSRGRTRVGFIQPQTDHCQN